MKKINFKIRKNVNVDINRQSKNIFKFKENVKNRLGNINDSVIRNIISSKLSINIINVKLFHRK